jgi:VanZ family protein
MRLNQRSVIMLAATATFLTLLFLPLPSTGRVGAALFDLAHVPAFALLAVVAYRLSARRPGGGRFQVLVWLGLMAFSVASEPLQGCLGRESCWSDAAANLVGVTAGTVWTMVPARSWLALAPIALIVACTSLPPLCRLLACI